MSIRDVEIHLASAQEELENEIWLTGQFTPELNKLLNDLHDVMMFALKIDIEDRKAVRRDGDKGSA